MSKLELKPEIGRFRVADLKLNPANAREITEQAAKGLAKSLETFGYVDLIVVNKRDMVIVSGHQRFQILKASGAEELTALVVDLDEKDRDLLAVTMNNREIMGDWTREVLVLLEEIKANQGNLFSDLRLDALRRDLSGFEIADERMNWVKQEIAAGMETTCPKCGEKFNEQ